MLKNVKRSKINLAVLLCLPLSLSVGAQSAAQPELGHHTVPLLKLSGLTFKDLNRDGKVNPYEDWRRPAKVRAADLVKRMTLAEKAGVMMHGTAPAEGSTFGNGSVYDMDATRKMVVNDDVNSLITRLNGEDPTRLAEQNNHIQQTAENTRLGIPVTISTDPRNSYQALVGISNPAGKFTQWPEAIGVGAIGSEKLAQEYADSIRREYRAVGITEALSPQADIVTEPRWARISGTFGEDPELARKLVRGYIAGMQKGGNGLNSQSVAAVVKHWVGYGAAQDGWDGHNAYGKNIVLTAESLKKHIIPFQGAFEAHAAAVMPTYSVMKGIQWQGKELEPVAAGFNRYLLTDLLRDQYKFDGVVISDWLITNDCDDECVNGSAPGKKPVAGGMPWGVESLTKEQRFVKAVNAGIDQFGGVTDSAVLVDAVKKGLITEARLNASVKRILQQKFELGLFEQPYVDAAQASNIVGAPETKKAADAAQFRSLVLLQNKNVLPLKTGTKVWLYGADKAAAERAGLTVVATPEEADVALMRTSAPFEQPHYNYFFGRRHHEGSLEFNAENKDFQMLKKVSQQVPVILTMYMERPAVLANVTDKTHAFIANFGLSDEVLFNRLTSDAPYSARLPFALPASMASVLKQKSDESDDLDSPLFPRGYGLAR
ncbi:beta-glucosidase [Pantoea alhagi]|uniref:glycoside hydrolase family 3 protein n=1 Tax=Mixta sp. BE291 TaxID=3158787 RepID=UPI0028652BB6|nr:beta-glucosidase [Pantoea alhagi]